MSRRRFRWSGAHTLYTQHNFVKKLSKEEPSLKVSLPRHLIFSKICSKRYTLNYTFFYFKDEVWIDFSNVFICIKSETTFQLRIRSLQLVVMYIFYSFYVFMLLLILFLFQFQVSRFWDVYLNLHWLIEKGPTDKNVYICK